MIIRCVLTTFKRSFYSDRVKSLFLNNVEKISKNYRQEGTQLNELIKNYEELISNINEIEGEIKSNKNNKEMEMLMKDEKKNLEIQKEELTANVLNEIYKYEQEKDENKIAIDSSCLFEISSGVGGKEAMLFANELSGLYENYFTYKNWKLSEKECGMDGEYLRHFKVKIEGINVWDNLKYEVGVHRVQRIPKTEAKGRIHTSTATIACIPITIKHNIVLQDKDLKIETKRASGAGGQHVNKTESAVRITHLPTGVSVESQEDKVQLRNKENCLRKIQKILVDTQNKEMFEKYMKTKKTQVGRANRNEKVRTYNFSQDRVTDHRLSSQNTTEEKEGTQFDLEDFFNSPERLDKFIDILRRFEEEQELCEILIK